MSDLPPPNSSLGAPPPRPSAPIGEPQSSASRSGASKLLMIALGLVSLVAVGLGALYVSSIGGTADAEEERDEALASVDDLDGQMQNATQRIADLAGQVDDAEAALTERQAEVDELQAEVDEGAAMGGAVLRFFATVLEVEGTFGREDAECVSETLIGQSDPASFLDRYTRVVGNPSERDLITLSLDLAEAAERCGTEVQLTEPLPGNNYGDNAELDGLWDLCAVGNDVACDDLYLLSQIGSGYELFGGTCGERFDEIDFAQACVARS